MSTCPQCGATYPPQVSICAVDGMVLAHEPTTDPSVGSVMAGKYRIDGVIGRGGMGAVYRATHVMLNKTVAVKTIKPDLIGSPEMAHRFQREARAATSLEHPNIVAVYDLGQAEDGALYIAMEFVNGLNLKDAIRGSGPMPAARIARLLTQVASALARAHRSQIVHRDLKPQNLMIAVDASGQEHIKLLDFGIAKSLQEGTTTQLTASGYSLGTPHYMAPEQAVGEEVDGRADIYALGVILYEMLVGDVPFNAASAPAILVMHLKDAPEPPSRRRPDLAIPPALEVIALRCLEKDPAHRFQTAEEFSEALERAVPAGTAVALGPAPDAATALALLPPLPENTAPPLAVPAETSSVAVPPPLPSQRPASRPTIKAPEAAVLPAAVPSSPGRKGLLVAALLALAALFFVAVALGGYGAYRVWTSRSRGITAETISSDPAARSVPSMAPDTAPPPATPSAASPATVGFGCGRGRSISRTAPASSDCGRLTGCERHRGGTCRNREERRLRARGAGFGSSTRRRRRRGWCGCPCIGGRGSVAIARATEATPDLFRMHRRRGRVWCADDSLRAGPRTRRAAPCGTSGRRRDPGQRERHAPRHPPGPAVRHQFRRADIQSRTAGGSGS